MALKLFAIPALSPEQVNADLANFLATHRVVTIDRQLVQDGAASYWNYFNDASTASHGVGREHVKPAKRLPVDYREVLSEGDFQVFARLRELRKEVSRREVFRLVRAQLGSDCLMCLGSLLVCLANRQGARVLVGAPKTWGRPPFPKGGWGDGGRGV